MNIAAKTVQGLNQQAIIDQDDDNTASHETQKNSIIKKPRTKTSMPAPIQYCKSEDLSQLIENMINMKIEGRRRFIGNPDTGKAHMPGISENSVQSIFWHTRCGWPYGRGLNHVGLEQITDDWTQCKKCIKAAALIQNIDNDLND